MFTPRRYDPSRPSKPATERQKATRNRNWRIFKLRGLYCSVGWLTGERRAMAKAAIDLELELLGAEGCAARQEREQREAERYEKFRAQLTGKYTVY